jgi:hypothetical protein
MSELDVKELLDTYEVSGTDYEEFKTQNQKMADMTKNLPVRGASCLFLSLFELPEFQDKGKVSFRAFGEEHITDFLLNRKEFPTAIISEKQIGEELLNELRKGTQLVINADSDNYIVSSFANTTLCQRSGVKGDTTATRQNVIRNLHYADGIISRNEVVNFVYREINTGKTTASGKPLIVKKIFSAMGSQFKPVPQTILSDIVETVTDEAIMGKTVTRCWKINHEYSDIYIEFPDMAEEFQEVYNLPDRMVPGILLSTSDIGNSSIIAKGVLSRGASYVITDEVSVQHKGDVEKQDVIEKINEKIFPNVRLLPETLGRLIGLSVLDYDKVDLSTDEGCEKNIEAVGNIIEDVAEKTLKQHLGVKRLKALTSCLKDEINSSIPYTLYDIAVTYMGIADRLEGIEKTTLDEVRTACAGVPYLLEKKHTWKKKNDEDNLILLSM